MWWLVLGLLVSLTGRLAQVTTETNDDDLCYWIDEGHAWINGQKATINIQLDKDYDNWVVTFKYDTEVVNLEAWKGDVAALSQSEFTVSARCYNNYLLQCQIVKRRNMIILCLNNFLSYWLACIIISTV